MGLEGRKITAAIEASTASCRRVTERVTCPPQPRRAMKTLHLLRHAKSSWKHADLDDHERPLSKRGRQTAKSIAAYLRRGENGPQIGVFFTAGAARAKGPPRANGSAPAQDPPGAEK